MVILTLNPSIHLLKINLIVTAPIPWLLHDKLNRPPLFLFLQLPWWFSIFAYCSSFVEEVSFTGERKINSKPQVKICSSVLWSFWGCKYCFYSRSTNAWTSSSWARACTNLFPEEKTVFYYSWTQVIRTPTKGPRTLVRITWFSN